MPGTAADIKMHMQSDQSAFGAFDGSRMAGALNFRSREEK